MARNRGSSNIVELLENDCAKKEREKENHGAVALKDPRKRIAK